jgi:hypothetical protein
LGGEHIHAKRRNGGLPKLGFEVEKKGVGGAKGLHIGSHASMDRDQGGISRFAGGHVLEGLGEDLVQEPCALGTRNAKLGPLRALPLSTYRAMRDMFPRISH